MADQLLDQLGVQRSQSIVILQPGARYWFKAWPPERFAELADRLTSQYGCQVLIGGSHQDLDLAQQIRQLAKSSPIVMAGRTTIKQFAAIAKKSVLFVGNDSGAMHIASAVGTSVVALFGPSNPREWGPRGGPVEILYKELDCRSCFHPTCTRGEENCMRLISVDEVSCCSSAASPCREVCGVTRSSPALFISVSTATADLPFWCVKISSFSRRNRHMVSGQCRMVRTGEWTPCLLPMRSASRCERAFCDYRQRR